MPPFPSRRLALGVCAANGITRRERPGERRIQLKDRLDRDHLILERRVVLPAGRVQVADYPRFLSFARSADDALSASIRVRLGG